MLKQRVITALILTPLIIWAIFALPDTWFNLLLLLFIGLAGWEWALLVGLKKTILRIIFAAILSIFWVASVFYIEPTQDQLLILLWLLIAWWLLRTVRIVIYKGKQASVEKFHPGRALNALIVIAAPFYLVHVLRNMNDMPGYLLYALMIIWAADTFAYFAGRQWGKQKLAPMVSPGKSWQGVYGAIASGVVATIIGSYVFGFGVTQSFLLLAITLITISMSIIGDLSESLYKRELDIKDSGHILPGHGGVLDRIDSLTAAIPVFMLGMYYMGLLS